jgi:hypothetical protein
MASRDGAEPSLNLLDTEIMIDEVGAKVSRSLLENPGLLDPERRSFSPHVV